MKVINLEEYRRAKRIQEVAKKQRDIWPAREKLKNHLKEILRKRLREKMNQTTEEDI